MTKIWIGVFWGAPEDARPALAAARRRSGSHAPALMIAATIALVGGDRSPSPCSPGPIYDISDRAAEGLLHPQAYIQAVLP